MCSTAFVRLCALVLLGCVVAGACGPHQPAAISPNAQAAEHSEPVPETAQRSKEDIARRQRVIEKMELLFEQQSALASERSWIWLSGEWVLEEQDPRAARVPELLDQLIHERLALAQIYEAIAGAPDEQPGHDVKAYRELAHAERGRINALCLRMLIEHFHYSEIDKIFSVHVFNVYHVGHAEEVIHQARLLVQHFPESRYAPPALMFAANLEFEGGRFFRAISIYRHILQRQRKNLLMIMLAAYKLGLFYYLTRDDLFFNWSIPAPVPGESQEGRRAAILWSPTDSAGFEPATTRLTAERSTN